MRGRLRIGRLCDPSDPRFDDSDRDNGFPGVDFAQTLEYLALCKFERKETDSIGRIALLWLTVADMVDSDLEDAAVDALGILGIPESVWIPEGTLYSALQYMHVSSTSASAAALLRALGACGPHRLRTEACTLGLPRCKRFVHASIVEVRVDQVGHSQPEHGDAAERVGLLALELAEGEILERLGEVHAGKAVVPVAVVEAWVARVAQPASRPRASHTLAHHGETAAGSRQTGTPSSMQA